MCQTQRTSFLSETIISSPLLYLLKKVCSMIWDLYVVLIHSVAVMQYNVFCQKKRNKCRFYQTVSMWREERVIYFSSVHLYFCTFPRSALVLHDANSGILQCIVSSLISWFVCYWVFLYFETKLWHFVFYIFFIWLNNSLIVHGFQIF